MHPLAMVYAACLTRRGWSGSEASSALAYRTQAKVGLALRAITTWIGERYSRRRAVLELRELSDELLLDIGIERYQIEAEVRERWVRTPAWRPAEQRGRTLGAARPVGPAKAPPPAPEGERWSSAA